MMDLVTCIKIGVRAGRECHFLAEGASFRFWLQAFEFNPDVRWDTWLSASLATMPLSRVTSLHMVFDLNVSQVFLGILAQLHALAELRLLVGLVMNPQQRPLPFLCSALSYNSHLHLVCPRLSRLYIEDYFYSYENPDEIGAMLSSRAHVGHPIYRLVLQLRLDDRSWKHSTAAEQSVRRRFACLAEHVTEYEIRSPGTTHVVSLNRGREAWCVEGAETYWTVMDVFQKTSDPWDESGESPLD